MSKDRLMELLWEEPVVEIGNIMESFNEIPEEVETKKEDLLRDNPSPAKIFDELYDKDWNKINLSDSAEDFINEVALDVSSRGNNISVWFVLDKMRADDELEKFSDITNATWRYPATTKTKYTRLMEWFAYGLNEKELAVYVWVAPKTIKSWIEKYPELMDRREALMEAVSLKARMNIIWNVALWDIETSMWYLERKNDEFATRSKTEHTWKNGWPIQVVNISIT